MEPINASLENLLADLIGYLPRLISGLVIFVLTLYASAWLARLAKRGMQRRKVDLELTVLLQRFVRISVLILGTVQALAQVDVDVTGFIAGLGIAGFTIGFAMQDVAKNFIAGVLLLLQQPFAIDDAIEVAGYGGVVKDITLRTTELHTWDGLDVLIPNGDVYVKPIVNYSRFPRRKIQIKVSLSKAMDLSRLTQSVIAAVVSQDGVLGSPPPEARWTAASEKSTELTLRYWVDTELRSLRPAQNDGLAAVRAALEKIAGDSAYAVQLVAVDGP